MSEVELLSDVGADYTRLRDLLADGKWKEADEETGALMLKVARRETQGWLDSDSIRTFPCTDLRTIDKLWVEYSKGHFGFSVQTRIYEEVGTDPEKWGDRVGWRKGGVWLDYSGFTFDSNAPVGHLPGRFVRFAVGWGWWLGPFFSSRCVECDL